jgi:hypothetical protein
MVYIFNTKNINSGILHMVGPGMENAGIFMPIRNILRPFGIHYDCLA